VTEAREKQKKARPSETSKKERSLQNADRYVESTANE
jgi:hypothetical protein